MQQPDRKRFAMQMAALGEYYGAALSAGLIEMYWQGLQSYSIDDFERAVAQHMRNPENGQFRPKISDLVKLIEGSTTERAAVAWSKVRHAVRSVGPYQTLVFDDPLIHVCIENMGGFGLLCNVETDEMPFRQQEFEKQYRSYAARGEVPEYRAKLIGSAEADCLARGYLQHIPAPVFVGDPERARLVLQRGTKASIAISAEKPIAQLVDLTARRLANPERQSA